MATQAEAVMDQAIAWHLALAEAGAEEWHAFVAWLEADPVHADVYDWLADADNGLERLAEITAPACARRVWPQRIVWGLSGLAAIAAAWLALVPGAQSSSFYAIETAPGVHRQVTLADGTQLRLNGGTRVVLDRADPRRARLEHGEALFEVVHHADRPFELAVGGVTLRDVGTRFNVAARPTGVEVAVAEGAVLYEPDAEALALTRGMVLARPAGGGEVRVGRIGIDTVGGWDRGVLDFRAVPLGIVAEDIARSTGAIIRIADAGMAARLFTGTLRTDRDTREVIASLAALNDADWHRDGPSWVIVPKSASAR